MRGTLDDGATIARVKQEVWAVEPLQTFYDTASVEALIDASMVRQRFSATVMSAFALFALLLCATGIYAVISFTTAQRTREIGVRMALGANRAAILQMVLRDGVVVVSAGLVAGLVAAAALTTLLRSLLFEVRPADPLTMTVVGGIIALVGMAACWLPAVRAIRVDPIAALRIE